MLKILMLLPQDYWLLIKEKLLSKVTKGTKVGFILDEWIRMLLDMPTSSEIIEYLPQSEFE
jgi:hypothetical protein